MLRDLDSAEELAQDAFVAALKDWPVSGMPDKPGAWLMTTAKRRAIDVLRRQQLYAEKHAHQGEALMWQSPLGRIEDIEAVMDDPVGDARLGLIFTACHPVLPRDARAALTLRLLGGLSTLEIARAFLTSEATIAQRIVRAKRTLAESGIGFELPGVDSLPLRFASVLEVVYLIFNEGYAATSGEDLLRPALVQEAQRLGRVLSRLMPDQPEVLGLLALMEIQASRLGARVDGAGFSVPISEQNRGRWDQLLIRRGLSALSRCETLGGARGAYALQAKIAACHARARDFAATDWVQIAANYDVLAEVTGSPIVELNRAIAHSLAFGPAAGLELLDAIAELPSLSRYAPLPAARGDCLLRSGRAAEAKTEFERAAALSQNTREQEFLRRRAEQLGGIG